MTVTVDTSVLVAAFTSWHESHSEARRVLDAGPALIAHCAAETYSVLTRLPAPHRVPPTLNNLALTRDHPFVLSLSKDDDARGSTSSPRTVMDRAQRDHV